MVTGLAGGAGGIRRGHAAGAQYGICWSCLRRTRLALDESPARARCGCGRSLSAYDAPVELTQPARGVPVRLARYWIAGREDGFWGEHRVVWVPFAQRERVGKREAQRTYAAGQRAGMRLRATSGPLYARRGVRAARIRSAAPSAATSAA
jgi:hypothetical protein